MSKIKKEARASLRPDMIQFTLNNPDPFNSLKKDMPVFFCLLVFCWGYKTPYEIYCKKPLKQVT